MAIPTEKKPYFTIASCHGGALSPGAVMGERLPVANIAASVVKAQFMYVP